MGVDHPLGPAGRARAVEDQAGVVGGDRRVAKRALGRLPRGVGVDDRAQLRQLGTERLDHRPQPRPDDRHPGAAVGQEVPQLVAREAGVQRQGGSRRRRSRRGGPRGTAASPPWPPRPGHPAPRRAPVTSRHSAAPGDRARRRSTSHRGRSGPAARTARRPSPGVRRRKWPCPPARSPGAEESHRRCPPDLRTPAPLLPVGHVRWPRGRRIDCTRGPDPGRGPAQ